MTSERRKVLFLVPSLITGGAQRVFSVLLRHLDRTRFEPHLAVLQATGPYIKDIPSDVTVHDLKVSRVRYALPSIIRVIQRVRPDAVLSTLGHLNLTLIWAKPFIPRKTKLLIREAAIATSVLDQETRYPRLWKWMYRQFYRKADTIVCLSDTMVNDMAEHFRLPREQLVRIYNPVDVERICTFSEAAANPFVGAGPHIVAASRLSRQKGFDVLLDAMPDVLARIPGASLWILGEGPLELALKEQAGRLRLDESVKFLGFQDNPWPYFKHADVFVLSSRYEGLPNVVLESLALGTPVVASDCPGGVREIRAAGNPVTLVPPEMPAALAEAIVAVYMDTKDKDRSPVVAKPGLREFDLQHVVEQYSRLF
jgi:glycosyltransferase involved in cell wall biosynthesis